MAATRSKLLASILATLGLLAGESAFAEGAITAVRALGISNDTLSCKKLEQELNMKGYIQTVCIKQKVVAGKGAKYYQAIGKKYKVDAALVSSSKGSKEVQVIAVENGKPIVTFKGNEIKGAENLSDAIVAAFPYRGFVTSVKGDEVEINLGSKQGIKAGTYLKVFEIGTPQSATLAGPQKQQGIIMVSAVSEKSSTAKIVDRETKITRFAKIAHEDAEPPKQSALSVTVASQKTTWLLVGTELRTIRTTAKDPTGANRDYTMNLTPFINLGLGRGKLTSQLAYGYAANTDESLSYLSLHGAYLIRSTGTFTSGTTIAAGLWLSQFNATAKKTVSGQVLQDFTRYAPYIEYRYQRVIKDKVVLGLTGELGYPMYTSDQDLGQMIQSYAVSVIPSVRIRTSDWLMFEAGIRLQRIAVSIKSDTGTTETHSGPFLRGLILF